MKKEQVEKANIILAKIKKITDSEAYSVCFRVLKKNAPYIFGYQDFTYKSSEGGSRDYDSRYVRREDNVPFEMADEKDEIQDEYIRFIERVQKLIDRKLAKLEKELEELKGE